MPKIPPNPSLGKKREKKVKAWYIDLKLKKFPEFSGEAWEYRARIFPTKKIAQMAGFNNNVSIIPCTITYSIPCKKK